MKKERPGDWVTSPFSPDSPITAYDFSSCQDLSKPRKDARPLTERVTQQPTAEDRTSIDVNLVWSLNPELDDWRGEN